MTTNPPLYPTTLAGIAKWRQHYGVTADEGRKRFVQFAVLQSIGDSDLFQTIVFKGGNALRFLHENPRGTVDLDFSALPSLVDDESEIRLLLNDALQPGARRLGIRLRSQKVARNPPSGRGTMPTYDVTVAFQFPGDRYYLNFDARDRPIPEIVRLEISLNEMICETESRVLADLSESRTHVCTIEDILAEKLRALLQQITRKRHRPQDVYDIASMSARYGETLDREKIALFLRTKAEARAIMPSRNSFNHDIKEQARTGYEDLQLPQGQSIPFDEAWDRVMTLVKTLNIPD